MQAFIDDTHFSTVIWLKHGDEARLKADLGSPNITYLSTIDPSRVKREKLDRRTIRGRYLSLWHGFRTEEDKADIESGGIYVERFNTEFKFGAVRTTSDDAARQMLVKARSCNLIDADQLLVANADLRPRLEKRNDWDTFADHCQQKVAHLDRKILADGGAISETLQDRGFGRLCSDEFEGKIPADIRKLRQTVVAARTWLDDNAETIAQLRLVRELFPEQKKYDPPTLTTEWQTINAKYLLLSKIIDNRSTYYGLTTNEIFHYIQAVDNQQDLT